MAENLDKTLTYYEVVQEILKRVNDANGDIYLDRAKELVFEGIASLALSEGVAIDDIRGILKSDTVDVSTLSSPFRIRVKGSGRELTSNPSKIISITDDLINVETVTTILGITEHKYIELSLTDVNRLNDPDYRPFNDEIFYYNRGDYIYFYPLEHMNSQKILVTYITEPDTYDYGVDGVGSTSLQNEFSLSFLYKTIDYGVGRIKQQQSGE
tara:strand:+ start:2610 stop:3245 length:636 start_codon:yes stop_codon:yes gene_type:complete